LTTNSALGIGLGLERIFNILNNTQDIRSTQHLTDA